MRGICFIEPLHGKTVKNIKTETRRIITKQPLENESIKPFVKGFFGIYHKVGGIDNLKLTLKPRYNVGDILYMKEPYKKWTRGLSEGRHTSILYKYGEETPCDKIGVDGSSYYTYWKNKLFMPAYAARHFIKVTAVHAERLQDISNEDCIKEGIVFDGSVYSNGLDNIKYLEPRAAYKALINSIDGKDTWDNNPWVWVYDYELIDRKGVQL